jgi:hypothetical protein
MSRNFRQRAPPAPAPKRARRKPSTATTESSDDDYNGIEDISSDEEDEPDVERAEEQAIMETLSPASLGDALASRSFQDDLELPWTGFPSEDDEFPTNQFFEEHISRGAYNVVSDGDISPRRGSFGYGGSESSEDSSEIGEITDDMFPDIFVAQDALDPTFRREMEANREEDQGSDAFCFDDSEEEMLLQIAIPMSASSPRGDREEEGEDEAQEYSDLSEDDYDDDTEDDEEYGQLPGQTGPRTVSARDLDSSEEEMTIAQRTPAPASTPMRLRKPRLATWIHDLSEPFTVLNSDGKTLLMVGGRDREDDSAGNNGYHAGESPSHTQESALLGNPGTLMMSATFGFNFNDAFGGIDFIGPPEAFFAGNNSNSDYSATADNSSVADDLTHRELEDEFLDLGDDEDEAEEDPNEGPMSPSTVAELSPSKFTTPKGAPDTPQNTLSTLDPLIAHLTKTNVGAFRNNQNRHHQLTSNMVSAESLAFHSPQGPTPIRGVRSGRLGHTNKALTPQRKQRVHPTASSTHAFSSPLGKRKASHEATGHQNSRQKF